MSGNPAIPDPIPVDWGVGEDATEPVAVWMMASDPRAEVLLQVEALAFPEAPLIFGPAPPEASFVFMALCQGSEVRHFMRASASIGRTDPGWVPFFFLELAESGQGVDLDEARAFYRDRGVLLERAIGIDSTLRLGRQDGPVSTADLSYLALFDLANASGCRAVFAHLNLGSIKSFDRVGLHHEPVLGRADLFSPDGSGGEHPDYRPVCIPNYGPNEVLLSGLAAVGPKSLWLDADGSVHELDDLPSADPSP